MNFPNSVARKILSPVFRLIIYRMLDIEKCFAGNSDDGSLIECQSLSRAKRESRTRPTENRFANFTPPRFRRYFNNDDPRFMASHVLKFDMQITVRFSFYNNYAARERIPVILDPGALRLSRRMYGRPRPTVDVARCDGFNRAGVRRWSRGVVFYCRAALSVTTFARRFKRDWLRAGRRDAKKSNGGNRERRSYHYSKLITTLPRACPSSRYRIASGTSLNL
jgi:hypothetical protein